MQFFYSQFQNSLTQPFLHFLVYFLFLNVRQTIIYTILDYLKIYICRLKVPFHGAHHLTFLHSFSNLSQFVFKVTHNFPEILPASFSYVGAHIVCYILKVHPHYTARHIAAKVVPCQKYMWTLHRLGCGMPFDAAWPKNSIGKLLVPSKEAAGVSKWYQPV